MINLFWVNVIEQGMIDKEVGRALGKLFSLRESVDYSTIDFFSEDDANDAITYAKNIVYAIEAKIHEIAKE